jgi:hypothetical protein
MTSLFGGKYASALHVDPKPLVLESAGMTALDMAALDHNITQAEIRMQPAMMTF